MHILKIDPEFKSMIPPLSEDELQLLEQNILAEGKCRDAIKVWRGYIIDGHNRYQICQNHNISYRVKKIPLMSKTDALVWIADNQLGRRNLTPAMRIEIAAQKIALQQQGGNKRKQIAEAAGVSEKTVYKYMKIAGSGAAELIQQVRSGEVKIGTAHKNLYMDTKTVEVVCSGSTVHYVNALFYTNKIEQMYEFLKEQSLPLLDADEMCLVKKLLEGQLSMTERMF